MVEAGLHNAYFAFSMFHSQQRNLDIDRRGEAGRILLLISTLLIFLAVASIGYGQTCPAPNAALGLPAHLGEVVYQQNSDRNDRIYIIAQSHRSAITGEENGNCQRVQAEVYRIGEWLIANEKVEALLPEGYFCELPASGRKPDQPVRKKVGATRLDDAALVARLSDPSVFANADRLLYANYNLSLCQVEDRGLYLTAVEKLRSLLSVTPQKQPDPGALASLMYYQQKRSAVILRNIPQALAGDEARDRGEIHRAMLTIGLAHVGTIIDFLNNGKAQVLPPINTTGSLKAFTCDLRGLEKNYAITVILPRTLADLKEGPHPSQILHNTAEQSCCDAKAANPNT